VQVVVAGAALLLERVSQVGVAAQARVAPTQRQQQTLAAVAVAPLVLVHLRVLGALASSSFDMRAHKY